MSLIIDNFAGGGGASTGIELAIGRSVDIAINHDPDAIAMHKANHPTTKHYCESVWEVNPLEATNGKKVDIAWFSPDCKHFSKARGSKPKDKSIRGLAWVALRWAATVKPRIIFLENVEEFKTWGPVDEFGKPLEPSNHWKGYTFRSFVYQLKKHGYDVEWKELRACDFGAPTTRKRFFLIARCDGEKIIWPTPTHTEDTYRTASEIIDWSLPGKSIFNRTRPLAENTMKRIFRGLKKYVLDDPQPFIVRIGQTGYGGDNLSYSINQPLTTITTKQEHILVTPYISVNNTNHNGSSVKEPVKTLTSVVHEMLITPELEKIQVPFIVKNYGGTYNGNGIGCNEPLHTITSTDHHSLVSAYLTKFYGNEKDGQSIKSPLHTIPSKDRFGLVTIHGLPFKITDIKMRMLQPHELYKAQGFPDTYIIDRDYQGKKYPKHKQVARCGNAVPPQLAKALVESNVPELCQVQKKLTG